MGYATSFYDGGWDGTDDEPEAERLARLAREKVLREEAAAASLAFRGTNLFSDNVTTGADGGRGPTTLDPFNVIGVRETEAERIARESLEGDPFFGGSSGGAGSLATNTTVTKPGTIPIGDPSKTITVPTDPSIVGVPPGETPEQALARIAAAEAALDDAAMKETQRLKGLNPLNPVIDIFKSASTGAWEVIKDPAQGLGNVATNIGEIFNPDSKSPTNVVTLPVDPVTGAVLTAAQLANANDVTRATDELNKAKAAAATGRRNGVSEEDQADLDYEVEERQTILNTARGKTASQGGAAGVVTAIGAAAAGGTAAGTGAGAGGAAAGGAAAGGGTGAGAGGAAAGATQTTTPTNVAVGGVFDQKTLDAVAAAQTQAQAIAAAQTTPRTNVVTPAPINGADIIRQTQVGLNPAPIFEQPAVVSNPIETLASCEAKGLVLHTDGRTCVPKVVVPNRIETPASCEARGLVLHTDGKTCVPKVITLPPVTGPNCDPATQQLSPDGKTCVPKVITSCNLTTHEVVNGACVVKCGSGQERNTQGVCVVRPGPGTTTTDPTLILPIPPNPFTMSTITADQRDLYTELGDTTDAFKRRRNALRDVYGDALGDYSDADMDAYERISGRMRGTNVANTEAASAQTIAANRALRDANLADVNRLGGEALLNRQSLNSQLYGNLNQYSKEASAALGRDMDALRLAEAKQLSPEDIRNSQQAAREAWSARGLVNSRGAVGAEILNRDSLGRQREAEARAKVQQSYGNLQQATAMEMANVFDPQAAILGGQYGMQTQNYGTNAALYGQSAEQTRGSQDYVRRVFNPMGEYPNNIYDFNANATTAASISEANNAAAVAAAREAGQYGLAGAALRSGWVQDAATGVWKFVRSALGGS